MTARDHCVMGFKSVFIGVRVGSDGRQAWLWLLHHSGPAAALGGRQRFCTSERIRSVPLLEIDFGAIAHGAMWGYGVDPRRLPTSIWVWCRACHPDPAGTAAAVGDHGVHGSVLRRQRPAEPAGSAGRGAGLCGASCVSRTAQVMGLFDLSPSSGPFREIPERSTAGQQEADGTGAAPPRWKHMYPWRVVAF